MAIMGFLQVILVVVLPLLQVVLGKQVFALAARCCGCAGAESPAPNRAALLCLGLLTHLTLLFFLKVLGLPWLVALVVPLLPVLIRIRSVQRELRLPELSLNFVAWFFVAVALGLSLFYAVRGIETPWANNYGDLTFHLGMISSFVFGDNFPPQYHLFAGERLSYPFMVNLWSAGLWWLDPSWKMLSFIFAFQWVVVWCLIFFLLNGNRYRLLPWALLFGGGAFQYGSEYSWTLIQKGHPWTVFLTTIWVTQRSAMLGICALLAALALIADAWRDPLRGRCDPRLVCGGLLFALSPLVHAHICMVGILFVLLVLSGRLLQAWQPALVRVPARLTEQEGHPLRLPVLMILLALSAAGLALVLQKLAKAGISDAVWRFRARGLAEAPGILLAWKTVLLILSGVLAVAVLYLVARDARRWVRTLADSVRNGYADERGRAALCALLTFTGSLLPALIFLPWLLGKTGMVSLMSGWSVPLAAANPVLDQLATSAGFWVKDAWPFLLMVVIFWCASARHLECGALLLLFVLGNVLKLAAWEWDQIKVFIAIYAVFLFVWSREKQQVVYRLHYVCLILAVPGILEAWRIFNAGESYTVFSPEALAQAEGVRKAVPVHEIVASAPDHNSPVVLSGRPMFMGYTGTLWSHGLPYQKREEMLKDVNKLCACPNAQLLEANTNVCPQWLFWTSAEQRYFRVQQPCAGASRTAYDYLYALPRIQK